MQWNRVCDQLLALIYVTVFVDLLQFAVSARQIRRICKNEIDLLADSGVRIEPVDRSHAELLLADHSVRNRDEAPASANAHGGHGMLGHLLDSEDQASNPHSPFRFVIKFDFKTSTPHGILFYGRQRENARELIALRLAAGALYYKIQCPTVSADVLIPTSRLDDGQWHSVSLKFRKGGLKAHVEVDGIRDSKTYEVSCEKITSLVFGGVSPIDKEMVDRNLGHVPHFEGCIRSVQIPTALTQHPKYYAVSVCD